MVPFMPLHIVFSKELFIAISARVPFLADMNSFMRFQIVMRGEGFTADVAFVFSLGVEIKKGFGSALIRSTQNDGPSSKNEPNPQNQ